MKVLPILLSDSYKQFHFKMYPKDLTLLYSNMTPRKSRLKTQEAVWFGLQYYMKEYLVNQWNELFFKRPIEDVLAEFNRFHKHFSFTEVDNTHITALHKLGYLPIVIKALPEGTSVPMRVPFFTIYNTHPDFAWLVNFIETAVSCVVWDMTVNATISKQYRTLFDYYAELSGGDKNFVDFQGHDFSMRGRSSIETCFNQAGHLLSFKGSDTIPAVLFLEQYYRADIEKELVATSVPATEHSVMMCGGKNNEIGTFAALMDEFPSGILSIVSDTWNLWDVLTKYLPELKEKVLARNGKIVIRPDSGNPADIICGDPNTDEEHPAYKGVVELLWDIFGGKMNGKGFKELSEKIGCIYGDSITLEIAEDICKRLIKKGFATTNWVAGIGSYTFNHNTRDTLGIAMKATYCERNGEGMEIFKDPITDDGTKKSAKGLIAVHENEDGIYAVDRQTWDEEKGGLLEVVFKDGEIVRETTLSEIRRRVR